MNRRGFFGRMISAVVAAKIVSQIETIGYVAPEPLAGNANRATITTSINTDGAVYFCGADGFYRIDANGHHKL